MDTPLRHPWLPKLNPGVSKKLLTPCDFFRSQSCGITLPMTCNPKLPAREVIRMSRAWLRAVYWRLPRIDNCGHNSRSVAPSARLRIVSVSDPRTSKRLTCIVFPESQRRDPSKSVRGVISVAINATAESERRSSCPS